MSRDRMQRQRFELKYVLSESTALAVRQYASGHLELDEAGVDKPNFAYRVNSIYLDSPQFLTFWDWANANRNRFKLRMRFYDSREDTPVFLEIKRRVSSCILKQRCAIRKCAASLILQGQFPPEEWLFSREGKHRVALENFISLTTRLHAQPTALVTYLREAYVDPANDGVRLTLDREVRIAPCHTPDFSLNLPHYVQPFGHKVILELKFNNRYPNWFGEMVRLLDLSRSAAAKYCEGVASLWRPEFSNWGRPTRQDVKPVGPAKHWGTKELISVPLPKSPIIEQPAAVPLATLGEARGGVLCAPYSVGEFCGKEPRQQQTQ